MGRSRASRQSSRHAQGAEDSASDLLDDKRVPSPNSRAVAKTPFLVSLKSTMGRPRIVGFGPREQPRWQTDQRHLFGGISPIARKNRTLICAVAASTGGREQPSAVALALAASLVIGFRQDHFGSEHELLPTDKNPLHSERGIQHQKIGALTHFKAAELTR